MILELFAGIEHISELRLQSLRIVPHGAKQVDEQAVEVVVDLKVPTGQLMEQHPGSSAEHLDVAFVEKRETAQDLVPQCFLSPYPGDKAVHGDFLSAKLSSDRSSPCTAALAPAIHASS